MSAHTKYQYDEKYYEHELWLRIQKGLLTGKGKSFSFTMDILTEEIHFDFESGLFSEKKRWKQRRISHPTTIEIFDKAFATLPPTIRKSSQYKCFHDCRKEPDSRSPYYYRSSVINGYTITVSVSEAYAAKNYTHYATTALPFRDKLLATHIELLKKLTCFDDYPNSPRKSFTVSPGSSGSGKYRFYVTPTGVGDSSKLDVDAHGEYYAHYGMCNLKNLSECYGLALAIIELFRPEWEKYGIPNIEISVADEYGVSSIRVDYEVLWESSLQSW